MPLPELHAGQKSLLALPGRFRVGICGRRFGKTQSAMNEAVRVCESGAAGSGGVGKGAGGAKKDRRKIVWWFCPVLEQSRRVELELVNWLTSDAEGVPIKNSEWKHLKSQRALEHVATRSRIEFHSAEQGDRLRGAGLDLAILDEAADIPEAVWNNVVKPMLLERSGLALIIGTPRGTSNWLHRLYRIAEEKPGEMYSAVRLPTKENPRVPQQDLELFRQDMTEAEYRQEFEAEFIDGVHAVFKNIQELVGGPKLEFGRPGKRYITGVDLGQQPDFTVAVSLRCEQDAKEQERVDGFMRCNGEQWSMLIERIVEHVRRFPGPCFVDATGVGKPVIEALQEELGYAVRPFVITQEAKLSLVHTLAMGFEKKRLVLPDERVLIGELQSFQMLGWSPVRKFPLYGAPNGLHDDCVVALALAYWGLVRSGAAGSGGNPLAEMGIFA